MNGMALLLSTAYDLDATHGRCAVCVWCCFPRGHGPGRLASAVEVSGCLGGAVAEGVATVWRDDRVIVSSFHR